MYLPLVVRAHEAGPFRRLQRQLRVSRVEVLGDASDAVKLAAQHAEGARLPARLDAAPRAALVALELAEQPAQIT